MSSLTGKSGNRSTYSAQDKAAFFAALDRTGNVSAAAREVDIPRHTCYPWAVKAGFVSPTPRSQRQRRYSSQDKAAFFAAFTRSGNVSAAAREVGFPIHACYRWAVKAGLERNAVPRGRREEYLQLRSNGLTSKAAAQELGVSSRTASDWNRGVRKSGNRRFYPDGRVIDYKEGVTTFLTTSPFASIGTVEAVIDPRYLSVTERETIRDLLATGASMRSIARELGRPASTITREIRRNCPSPGAYRPHAAHRLAAGRRTRPKTAKLAEPSPLREFVTEKLRVHWSPEQICHALVKEHPTDAEMRVSPETIYQALYLQARGGLKKEVQAALRTGRTRRKAQTTGQERRSRFVDPMVMIADRPPEVDDRAVPGHWEGDLITGALNQSAIATLVERSTRFVMLVHLPGGHTAEEVRDGLVATIATLPAHLRGSLTWDQGAEMATHKSFSLATDMPVYFCDPGSPWQRGSNENTNGLLRQYFPKGTDLSVFGPEDLEHVAQELNGRPRKTLDWDNPAERFRDLLFSN